MSRAYFHGGPLDGKVVQLLVEPPEELRMPTESFALTQALAELGVGDPDPTAVDYLLVETRRNGDVAYIAKADLEVPF